MQILYHDQGSSGRSDSFHLILLHSGWYVVGKGYLCRVDDEEEGLSVMGELRSQQQNNDALR